MEELVQIRNETVVNVLKDIYQLCDEQHPIIVDFLEKKSKAADFDYNLHVHQESAFYSDKALSLDLEKGLFCYNLVKTLNAPNIIDAGTSFGASAIFMAAALNERLEKKGHIYSFENEEKKAKIAERNFRRAGLDEFITLKVGDILENIDCIAGTIDLVLLDICDPIPKLLIEHILNQLRPGSIILADNSIYTDLYKGYFEYLGNNGFSTVTLPFEGGLEFTVKN
ncbi:MAG: class I SAM-dependent methyltransferase [Pseudomonadota bacterium]